MAFFLTSRAAKDPSLTLRLVIVPALMSLPVMSLLAVAVLAPPASAASAATAMVFRPVM